MDGMLILSNTIITIILEFIEMVWYFNFCSPHLLDDEDINLNRTLMVVELLIAMIITFVVHMFAELYDEESSRGNLLTDNSEELG